MLGPSPQAQTGSDQMAERRMRRREVLGERTKGIAEGPCFPNDQLGPRGPQSDMPHFSRHCESEVAGLADKKLEMLLSISKHD